MTLNIPGLRLVQLSSPNRFIKWYPQNASLNVQSEEVTLGCWPSRQSGKEQAISETGQ